MEMTASAVEDEAAAEIGRRVIPVEAGVSRRNPAHG
jgi:hypothetical protein